MSLRRALVLVVCVLFPGGIAAQTFSEVSLDKFERRIDALIGVSIVDVDGDGRADILDGNGMHRQTDTGFSFHPLGVLQGGGALAVDLDGDGAREIIKLNFTTPLPYRYAWARGEAERLTGTGVDDFVSSTLIQGSLLLDDDRDGQTDIFLGDDGPPDVLLRNADGAFASTGLLPAIRTGTYGAAAADFDNDRDLDIYIGLCREDDGGTLNVLYRRDEGSYTSVADQVGVQDPNPSWGVAWLDYDNDGQLDLFVANMPSTVGGEELPGLNTLYRNLDLTRFENVAASAGVAGPTDENSWSVVAADFDNDGWTDLFVANRPEDSRLWRNRGDGTFEDVTVAAGLSGIQTIAIAAGDVNGDGWVDLVTGSKMFLNEGGSNHWIRIQLRGVDSNPDGIGARVEVTAGGSTQFREITGGDGMMAQSHRLEAHVGLGDVTMADVTVRWPSGQVTEATGVAADQLIHFVEDEGLNAPPAAFDLTGPVDGSRIGEGVPAELSWAEATDSDPVSYTVYLHRPDGSQASYSTSATTVQIPPSELLQVGTYGWAVVAGDGRTIRASQNRREFNVGSPVALEPTRDPVDLHIQVSPNPTRGRIHVTATRPEISGTLDLIDLRGRILETRELTPGVEVRLDMEGNPPGGYLIRFTGADGQAAQTVFVYTQ